MDRLEVRAGHGENVGGAIDQRGRQRLAAETGDIDAAFPADFDRVHARGLPANGMAPRRHRPSISLRLPSKRRKSPNAMGLRQMLPVQTKRTCFTTARRGGGDASAKVKSNSIKSTSSAAAPGRNDPRGSSLTMPATMRSPWKSFRYRLEEWRGARSSPPRSRACPRPLAWQLGRASPARSRRFAIAMAGASR